MQIVVFELGQDKFGLHLTQMKEIVRDMHITPVPNAPEYFEGVTNLRGKILPIINLKKRLGMKGEEKDEHKRIIVLEVEGELIGYKVDRVHQVLRISKDQIMDYDGKLATVENDSIDGILRMETGIICLLNLKEL